jgi:hypothetical protein
MATSTKTTSTKTTSTKSTDAAGRRKGKAGEPELAKYAETEPTALHQEFADWIEKKTGVKVDVKSIQLGAVLRPIHQKSEENQERIAAAKERLEAEIAEREERRVERAKRREEREKAAAAKAAEPKPERVAKAPKEPKAAPAAKPAKATPAKPAAAKAAKATPAAKAAPAKPAGSRRRSAAASDTTAF